MKIRKCSLFIRKLEIVNECDMVIYKVRDVPAVKGIRDALSVIHEKDGSKTVKSILKNFVHYLDEDFKKLLSIGDE